jgi:hypothetical protein
MKSMFADCQEMHLIIKGQYNLKVKGWKKVFWADGIPKQAEVAVLISDTKDFKTKYDRGDKES